MNKKIAILGAGKMGTAIAQTIISSKISSPKQIILTSPNKTNLLKLQKELKVNITTNNLEAVFPSEIIIIAVKPQMMFKLKDELGENMKDKLIVSIAAGITIETLKNYFPHNSIVRVMPNTPCIVGESASAFCIADNVNLEQKAEVQEILNSFGVSYEVKEKLLDIVTGLSGSGPAFFAYIIKAIAEAGIEGGLPSDIALKLAAKTAEGTGKLLLEKQLTPDDLITMVSSPNGTTIAGRKILESSDVFEIIKKTIIRSSERSKELGKNN